MQATARALITSVMTCTQTYREPSLKNEAAATAAGMIQMMMVSFDKRKRARS